MILSTLAQRNETERIATSCNDDHPNVGDVLRWGVRGGGQELLAGRRWLCRVDLPQKDRQTASDAAEQGLVNGGHACVVLHWAAASRVPAVCQLFGSNHWRRIKRRLCVFSHLYSLSECAACRLISGRYCWRSLWTDCCSQYRWCHHKANSLLLQSVGLNSMTLNLNCSFFAFSFTATLLLPLLLRF